MFFPVIWDHLVFVLLFSNALFLCVIICFHLLWLDRSKTLDSAYSKQMLEKQLQARACSPRPKSSQPSLSPTRAPRGPSTSSGQPHQKPAQAKRAVRGEMSRCLSLNTTRAPAVISTSDAVAATCIRTALSSPPLFFHEDIWSLIKPETTSGVFLAWCLGLLLCSNGTTKLIWKPWGADGKTGSEVQSPLPQSPAAQSCGRLSPVISCWLLLREGPSCGKRWHKHLRGSRCRIQSSLETNLSLRSARRRQRPSFLVESRFYFWHYRQPPIKSVPFRLIADK